MIYDLDTFKQNKDKLLKSIADGAVFVYPTDTIYGIGCDATNSDSAKKVRAAKQTDQAFSVIAPSKEWIKEHCMVSPEHEEWIAKLPGAYTLIFALKDQAVAPDVVAGRKTIGVRMPDHWIQEIAAKLQRPMVTTSANVHGKPFMTSLESLDPAIKDAVDFIIYEGPKEARPSTLVDLTGEPKVIQR